MRRKVLLTIWTALAAFVLAAPLAANGNFPEKIAIGKGGAFYVGSIPTGAIYRGNLRTGEGSVFIAGADGRAAIGVHLCHHRLYVAGGPTGKGFVYNARTGADVATLQLTTGSTFVNDVVVTRQAAWFTDSSNPVLYRVPLGPGGQVDPTAAFGTIPLSGDFEFIPDVVSGSNGRPIGARALYAHWRNGADVVIDNAWRLLQDKTSA